MNIDFSKLDPRNWDLRKIRRSLRFKLMVYIVGMAIIMDVVFTVIAAVYEIIRLSKQIKRRSQI